MESDEYDKKMCKAKSMISPPIVQREPNKRKSFNEAARSLDLALGRLKKSKLVNGECVTENNVPGFPSLGNIRDRGPIDMYMDLCPSEHACQTAGTGNPSMMSMNFSHYELARNLSSPNCNLDEAASSTTCNATANQADDITKDEHLERFFRSAELWTQKYREGGPSSVNFPKK